MTDSLITKNIPTNAADLDTMLAQLRAAKEQVKANRLASREEKKKQKASRVKIAGSNRTLSAEIKRTKKNEDGTESEAKGAVSIYGLNRMPTSLYVESLIPLIGFITSNEFAGVLERDAENASFQFGNKDAEGKAVAEKGTEASIAEVKRIAGLIRQMAAPIRAILAPEPEEDSKASEVSDQG